MGILKSAYNYGCWISGIASFHLSRRCELWRLSFQVPRIGVAKIQEVKSEDHLSLSDHIARGVHSSTNHVRVYLVEQDFPLEQMIYVPICS